MKENPFPNKFGSKISVYEPFNRGITIIQQEPMIRIGEKLKVMSTRPIQPLELTRQKLERYLSTWRSWEEVGVWQMPVEHYVNETFEATETLIPRELRGSSFTIKRNLIDK